MIDRTLRVLGAACVVGLMASPGMAATLTLSTNSDANIQHTENAPCIISNTKSCSQQPDGFGYAFDQNTGQTDGFNLITEDPNMTESMSGTNGSYLVSDIYDILGSFTFLVGIDVSQTGSNPNNLGPSNDPGDQTLVEFYMYINGALIDSFTGGVEGNVGATTGPGNGFADWTLSGFTSLAGYELDDTVTFRAIMADLNDGPDQLFLFAGPGMEVIPLPAAGWLLLGGLGGLAAMKRRRKAA